MDGRKYTITKFVRFTRLRIPLQYLHYWGPDERNTQHGREELGLSVSDETSCGFVAGLCEEWAPSGSINDLGCGGGGGGGALTPFLKDYLSLL